MLELLLVTSEENGNSKYKVKFPNTNSNYKEMCEIKGINYRRQEVILGKDSYDCNGNLGWNSISGMAILYNGKVIDSTYVSPERIRPIEKYDNIQVLINYEKLMEKIK
jgi:hypothetical protein